MKNNGKEQVSGGFWNSRFGLQERGTTIKREIFAGCTTFLCVSYILAVNPIILGASGMDAGAVFTATAISAIVMTLLLSVIANVPFAGVSGMGINAYFAYTVVVLMGHSFAFALTAQLVAGIAFLLIAVTPVRGYLFDAIPFNLKIAVTAGIGLFITLIGMTSVGMIQSVEGTIVGLGSLHDPAVLITLLGILLIGVFSARNVKGGMFLAVIICTVVAILSGVTSLPSTFMAAPPSIGPLFMQFDFSELMSVDMVFVAFTFLFVNLFNVVGVLIGLTDQAEIAEAVKDKTNASCMRVAALGTIVGSCLGTSPHIVAVESAAGIAEGGRTGLTALTISGLFVAALFFSPLLMIVPAAATAPVLIVVGFLMMGSIKAVNFEDITEGIPAFLTVIMMPFAYSIGVGVEWGLVSYVALKLLAGKHKDISIVMYGLAIIFILKEIIV